MSGDGTDGAERAEETAGEGFTFSEPPPEDDASIIARLAKLEPLEYDRVREAEAKQMGCRCSTLDAAVAAARPKPETATGKALVLHDPEPWAEPVSLAALLDDIERAVRRHVILPATAATLIALWAAHTWVAERFQHSPRLTITSPTKRCGKSTLVELLRILCRKTLKADSISASGTFRLVEALNPLTLLLDESDTFLRDNEELRGVLNSGFERSGQVVRTVEVRDEWQPVSFKTFCPVALAAIGKIPDTLDDRGVPIRLARKTAAETVHRMREPGARKELAELARKLCRWSRDDASKLGSDPAIPAALNDREGDLSVPLLSVADAAGTEWAAKARAALLDVLGLRAAENESAETGTLLLTDIRLLFLGQSATRMSSDDIVRRLDDDFEGHPWAEWRHGKPMTKTQLARALRPFGVKPTTLRIAGEKLTKGYYRAAFDEAWERYLTPDSRYSAQSGGPEALHRNNVDNISAFPENRTVTGEAALHLENTEKPRRNEQCYGVTDETPPARPNSEGKGWEATI